MRKFAFLAMIFTLLGGWYVIVRDMAESQPARDIIEYELASIQGTPDPAEVCEIPPWYFTRVNSSNVPDAANAANAAGVLGGAYKMHSKSTGAYKRKLRRAIYAKLCAKRRGRHPNSVYCQF